MTKRVSVREVAHAAGVAISTVSRVLNGSGYASPDVRLRVQQAVARLGYEPDYTARHLRTGHSRTIGCLLPSIANPFVAQLLSEVERLAQAAGYSLLVGSSEQRSRDKELVAFFENRRLEGIIALPAHEYDPIAASPFAATKLPTVIMDRDMGPGFDAVLIDHEPGMRQVMDYLLSLGHQRIALFAIGSQVRPGRLKLRSYRAALEAAGLPFDDRLVYLTDSSLESARQPMQRMLGLDAPPTAIVAVGTQLLSGAVHVVREAGMDIPRDMSVVAIGTMQTLELMYPPVTALRYNFQDSARAVVQLILGRIERTAPPQARTVVIPSDLILGSSCGPAPAR
ncbi:LacI family DNA-binding transcriptional regulator [Bordetella bronchiseptica]|uniref:LacI family DNA-binding transcriptional regulator n=1 Tax=Bordetella bronchiseptica TaxID=518 RepID=UPI000461ACB3|nr:LacI family DNA-binding transcriptional regulator [Bordetella bronchiseptica]AWP78259.1 LacI family transcriptional regulator [Bordetella bronchiseptica]KDB68173.1 small molecule-binding regulator domain protein [Bordetella bronchiseptica B20-10725633]KDB69447.1 small molecule-binding regulator domain protein [Bordetella bronchiseptica A1-7]KDC38026.1 periplasmic-binding protein-like domain protein [Bordetella bronchiseptica M435/02/3]SUV72566.1 LacI family regulatory protein [Bordetella br